MEAGNLKKSLAPSVRPGACRSSRIGREEEWRHQCQRVQSTTNWQLAERLANESFMTDCLCQLQQQ